MRLIGAKDDYDKMRQRSCETRGGPHIALAFSIACVRALPLTPDTC